MNAFNSNVHSMRIVAYLFKKLRQHCAFGSRNRSYTLFAQAIFVANRNTGRVCVCLLNIDTKNVKP